MVSTCATSNSTAPRTKKRYKLYPRGTRVKVRRKFSSILKTRSQSIYPRSKFSSDTKVFVRSNLVQLTISCRFPSLGKKLAPISGPLHCYPISSHTDSSSKSPRAKSKTDLMNEDWWGFRMNSCLEIIRKHQMAVNFNLMSFY